MVLEKLVVQMEDLENVRSPPHTMDKNKSQNNEILKYKNRM